MPEVQLDIIDIKKDIERLDAYLIKLQSDFLKSSGELFFYSEKDILQRKAYDTKRQHYQDLKTLYQTEID